MSIPTKRVLAVYYSQSGQLERVVRSVLGPLEEDPEICVVHELLRPVNPYPFPWPFLQFVDVFPECVYLDPPPLQPFRLDPHDDFDLIVLGHQPWYLSPCLPMTGFMQSPEAAQVLSGKPVVTVIACRNMWLMAEQQMRIMIRAAGGHLIDNVALVDQGRPAATFVTTPRWLLTGKKEAWLGVFPPAGVAEDEIAAASRFGVALRRGLQDGRIAEHRSVLHGLGAARAHRNYIAAERLGRRSFRIWGRIVRSVGKQGQRRRRPFLLAYVAYLIAIVTTVVPISIALRKLLLLFPSCRRKLAAEVAQYEQPSGR